MNYLNKITLPGALVRRLLYLYMILGLTPILAFIVIPLLYHIGTSDSTENSILLAQLLISSVVFVIVVFVGGLVTLRRLVLPIQELIKGAQSIGKGELSYRVPIRYAGDDELIKLTQTFNIMAQAVQEMRDDIEYQRKTLEDTLIIRESEFAVINNIAELTNQQTDLIGILNEAAKIVRNGLGLDLLSLFLRDEAGDFFCAVVACEEPYREKLLNHCKRRLDAPLILKAINSCQPVKATDIDWNHLSTELRDSYESMEVTKIAAEPIIRKDHVLGVIMLMRQGNNKVPEHKIALLHALTRHISMLIENVQLKQELRTLSILEERRHLANELHDSVTQSLFTLNLTAAGLRESLSDENISHLHRLAFDTLIEQTQHIQAELRTLINELRPVNLEEEDLGNALRRHAASLRFSSHAEVSVSIDGEADHLALSIQRNINRIAQEALSNVARHAQATRVQIRLNIDDSVVTLTIEDNGKGFDSQSVARSSTKSLGLISIRERTEMMGGALVIRSMQDLGTHISVTIPIDA